MALQLVAALAVTLGVMLAALRLLQRARSGGAARVALRVLQRVETGPRQAIALVQVVDRVLVVSLAENGSQLLTELQDDARSQVLASAAAPPPSADPTESRLASAFGAIVTGRWPATPFARFAKRAGLGVLLLAGALLVAPVAQAQAPAAAARTAAPKTAQAAPSGLAAVAGPSVAVPLAPKVDVRVGSGAGAMQMTGTVGLVVFMGFLTLLPAIVLLMTSFTRILIVLHFLRSALGTQTTPPSQLLAAIAVLLTAVIMNPVIQRTQQDALQPYFDGRITQAEAYSRGIVPFREFMLTHTREKDLAMFAEASQSAADVEPEKLPIVTIICAFVTSELRTAFQMGFALFLPFVVVDVVVASVLMSLGMFMLPPAMISLPFKLLLFVLADGWSLVFQNLIASFR
jgi:flagellar biosynthetic protein FliP